MVELIISTMDDPLPVKGAQYTNPKAVWRLLVEGWVFKTDFNQIFKIVDDEVLINSTGFFGYGGKLPRGLWTLVGHQDDKPKPERKRLSYEEALNIRQIEIHWPHGMNKLSRIGLPWNEFELTKLDLAERRGYPIYAVEESK